MLFQFEMTIPLNRDWITKSILHVRVTCVRVSPDYLIVIGSISGIFSRFSSSIIVYHSPLKKILTHRELVSGFNPRTSAFYLTALSLTYRTAFISCQLDLPDIYRRRYVLLSIYDNHNYITSLCTVTTIRLGHFMVL